MNGASASSELVALLQADGSSYTWVAATVGSQNAASYQLATGLPVMAIGGFNGSDPSPTLAQFQADVAQGRVHYFIAGDHKRYPRGQITIEFFNKKSACVFRRRFRCWRSLCWFFLRWNGGL